MVDGRWSMVDGRWSMVDGRWSMVDGENALFDIRSADGETFFFSLLPQGFPVVMKNNLRFLLTVSLFSWKFPLPPRRARPATTNTKPHNNAMNKPELFNENHQATYCPEDDKLRLYVGRVPRDEYEALRAEGWTSTPKQSKNGQGEFAATWTPEREDTALSYAGIILDEDAGPAERAADRAERFGGYRDNNLTRATDAGDRYDAGPDCHGYQSAARAVRAADRHDRHATRAVNAWDKADYWTRRTAGVISHALYLSAPSVRMGRIKTLEADLRKAEASHTESRAAAQARYDSIFSVAEHAAGTREKVQVTDRADFSWHLHAIREADGTPEGDKASPEQVRRAALVSALSGWRNSDADENRAREAKGGTRPAADIAREWLEGRTRPEAFNPEEGTRYIRHLRMRLAYEWQMLEAQGGRAATAEMEKGGTFQGATIAKVNKSPATGRVVSVAVIVPRVEGWHYKVENEPGTPYALAQFDTERAKPGAYQSPTPESLATLEAYETARKQAQAARKAKAPPCPLVNPTMADAERLQAVWNAENARTSHSPEPRQVRTMTQAEYSANSGGTFAACETVEIIGGGEQRGTGGFNRKPLFPAVAKVRECRGSVVVLTDKPQKPLPAAAWHDPRPAAVAEVRAHWSALISACANYRGKMEPEEERIFTLARMVGLAYADSACQFGLTKAGHAIDRELAALAD
jgi:hypothetical protein